MAVIRHNFTKYMYAYFFVVGMLGQYYLWKHQYYWLWAFLVLAAGAYVFMGQNKAVVGSQDEDFRQLEAKMAALIDEKADNITNYLFVNMELLDFLYEIRALKRIDQKNFDASLLRINCFLQVLDTCAETQAATSVQLERLALLKKEALNYFHSIIYSVVNAAEMKRHNELRYILEEKLHELYLNALETYGEKAGPIHFQEFGHDTKKSTFDLY
jgi:hypothetical protein